MPSRTAAAVKRRAFVDLTPAMKQGMLMLPEVKTNDQLTSLTGRHLWSASSLTCTANILTDFRPQVPLIIARSARHRGTALTAAAMSPTNLRSNCQLLLLAGSSADWRTDDLRYGVTDM